MADLSLDMPIIKYKRSKYNERQRLAEWIKNNDLTMCYLQETHYKHNIGGLKVKGWEMYHANIKKK